MPKRQRHQKQDGKPASSSESTTQDKRRADPDPPADVAGGDDDEDFDEAINEEEREEASQQQQKSLKGFLKQAKGQHYRVVEMRVVLVCSFGVFAKLMFSDALEKAEDTFITHAALTFAARKLVAIFSLPTWSPYLKVSLTASKSLLNNIYEMHKRIRIQSHTLNSWFHIVLAHQSQLAYI